VGVQNKKVLSMKKIIAVLMVSALLIQSNEVSAMSTARSYVERARAVVSQSKGLQAVVKFVQRKHLTDEERAFLKKVTLSAAVVAIVAAVTGLTLSNTKQRLSNLEKFTKENPFDPKAAHLASIFRQAGNEGINLEEKGPFAAAGNKAFIRSIVEGDDDFVSSFFCNQKNDYFGVDLNAAEFGFERAQRDGYTFGQLVAEYIINRVKARDSQKISEKTAVSLKVRRLEGQIERKLTKSCP